MGIHKFRLPPSDAATPPQDLKKGFVSGMDRMPTRTLVELRPGIVMCHRDVSESGKFQVPWVVEGQGSPIVSTATLAERPAPYDLAVELARGKLNDLRNQLSDWKTHLGLEGTPELETQLREAQQLFSKAATHQNEPSVCADLARASLKAAFKASDLSVRAYQERLLSLRHQHAAKLPTQIGCVLEGNPTTANWAPAFADACNAARLPISWRDVASAEGSYNWDNVDAQLAWCRRRGVAVSAGPLLEFRTSATPDWLTLFLNNGQALLSVILDWVRAAVSRYRGRIGVWHVVSRVGTPNALRLSEDDQIQVAARILQVCRQIDPTAQFIIDFDRPWAEWLGSSQTTHQLGPLHLGDYLARAELGMAGVGLEIAPGYSNPGSHMRDLLEFSRMLDLYALLNMPLHLTMAIPSEVASDSNGVAVQANQWPDTPTEDRQREWAERWVSLAVSKPFVRSITWSRLTEQSTQGYPGSSLFRPDGSPKPVVSWLKSFRHDHLG